MATTDAGEHFPKRVENTGDGGGNRRGVFVAHIFGKHLAFGGGMFAIGLDVNREVFVVARRGDIVVLDQSFDLRFGDSGNLTLVGVERGQTLGCFAGRADGTKRFDQVLRLVPFLSGLRVVFRNTETFSELDPQLWVVRRPGFFVDKIIEELTAGRLIVAVRVHGREISRERGDVVIYWRA